MTTIKSKFKHLLKSSKINNFFLKITKAKNLHCLGDSHLRMFQYTAKKHLWLNTRFHFCEVQGGTAMGLANPNSKTQALNVFKQYISDLSRDSNLLFCLGEVDCGFVIWYRAEKYQLSIDDQFNCSLQNYLSFLKWVRDQGFNSIIVSSVPLPTIPDDHNWGTVAKLRSEVKTSLRERTDLTIKYNRCIRYQCKKNNWSFLNYEQDIIDLNLMAISANFRHPNPLDHHLNEDKMSPILKQKLSKLGFW